MIAMAGSPRGVVMPEPLTSPPAEPGGQPAAPANQERTRPQTGTAQHWAILPPWLPLCQGPGCPFSPPCLVLGRWQGSHPAPTWTLATHRSVLRCLVENPFRSHSLDPACLTPTVVSLAKAAYDERLLP